MFNIYFNRSFPRMSWKSEDEVNRNLSTTSDSEDEEEEDDVSVASTKFSYFSINSSRTERSRKQARLSNYAFCIQVRIFILTKSENIRRMSNLF